MPQPPTRIRLRWLLTQTPAQPQTIRDSAPAWAAAAFDTVVVLVFAAVGRASHDEVGPVIDPVVGVLLTAWPFLVSAAAGWGLVRALSRRWPVEVGPGIPVVGCTVLLGMLLRGVTGRGTSSSFVLVATVVLGLLMLGWRAIAARVRPTRS